MHCVLAVHPDATQEPSSQVCVLEHIAPQEPQFEPSVAVSVQSPLQSVVPPEQVAPQEPFEQSCPIAHTVPHAPQLSGSSFVSAQ